MELPGVGQALREATRPIPEPGPGEVRLRIEACGVCGSDHFLQAGGFGERVAMPVVPGHEAAGRVDALGDGVEGWSVGDQAAIYYLTTPASDRWAAAGSTEHQPRRAAHGRGHRWCVRGVRGPAGPGIGAASRASSARSVGGADRRRGDADPWPQADRPTGTWRDAGSTGCRRSRVERRPAGQGVRGPGDRGHPFGGETAAGSATRRG